MKLEKILEDFASLLSERFSLKKMTNEDMIRYLFFYALNQNGISHNNIVLEYDHSDGSKKKIDTLIENFEGTSIVLEFKFYRRERNDNSTKNIGEIFRDFLKLEKLTTDARKLFVYVTDPMMEYYFQNRKDGLLKWYKLMLGEIIEIDKKEFVEFEKYIEEGVGEPVNVRIKSIMNKEIDRKYTLKVFELL